jgi:hypothetical protein
VVSGPSLFSIEPLVPWASSLWEGAILDSVESLTSSGALQLVRTAQPRDLAFLLYPAASHESIRRSSRLQTILSGRAELSGARLGLCACDLADPDVSEEDVFALLSEQAASFTGAWAARPRGIADVSSYSQVWCGQILKEAAASPAANGEVAALFKEGGEEWISPSLYL